MKLLGKIDENTLIPLSLLVVIIGGVLWLSNLYARTGNNSEALIRLESKAEQYQRTVDEINLRLTRIESYVERSRSSK